jgi:hypothetical protein
VLALAALLLLAGPERTRVPPDVPLAGIMELLRHGEVALLPRHNRQPFNALILTRSNRSCESVAATMMDVASWTKVWNIKDVAVLEQTPSRVSYQLQLDMILAPRTPGVIERPRGDTVIFNDTETGAQFIWTLEDTEGSCAMRYSMLETPGQASGWVAAIHTLEESAVDAANFGAGLSSARGFTRAADIGLRHGPLSAGAESAFQALAAHGTAFRMVRASKAIVARRVIDRPVDAVLWSLRDKRRWPDKIDVLSKVTDRGRTASYTVAAFGGRVSWQTSIVEAGDAHTAEGFTLTETVTGGDLERGQWRWRVRPALGGTDVELTWDMDVSEGSAIMGVLARTDSIARESFSLHFALSFMGDVVGGRPVGQRALAAAVP